MHVVQNSKTTQIILLKEEGTQGGNRIDRIRPCASLVNRWELRAPCLILLTANCEGLDLSGRSKPWTTWMNERAYCGRNSSVVTSQQWQCKWHRGNLSMAPLHQHYYWALICYWFYRLESPSKICNELSHEAAWATSHKVIVAENSFKLSDNTLI